MADSKPQQHLALLESRKVRALLPLSALSILLGLILTIIEFMMDSQAAAGGNGGMPGGWLLAIGLPMFLVPLLAVAGWLLIEFLKFSREEARQYRAWKKTLTPQERIAVNLAGAAVLGELHQHMKHSNREQREYHAARVMGGAHWEAYQQAQLAAMAAGGGPKSRTIRDAVMSYRRPQ